VVIAEVDQEDLDLGVIMYRATFAASALPRLSACARDRAGRVAGAQSWHDGATSDAALQFSMSAREVTRH
jgi:hypothetical protein